MMLTWKHTMPEYQSATFDLVVISKYPTGWKIVNKSCHITDVWCTPVSGTHRVNALLDFFLKIEKVYHLIFAFLSSLPRSVILYWSARSNLKLFKVFNTKKKMINKKHTRQTHNCWRGCLVPKHWDFSLTSRASKNTLWSHTLHQ